MEQEHESELKITSHPIQEGANVADHAYLEPKKLTMKVKMSDCATDIVPGQFVGHYTRSVSAYNLLLELQASRIPLAVHTRLKRYDNMLIQSVSASDDYMTRFGLECTVVLQEILVAKTQNVKVSKRKHTTGKTEAGVVSVKEVDKSVAFQIKEATGKLK